METGIRVLVVDDNATSRESLGGMISSFGMQAEDGTQFEAPIAPFTLAQPGALH